MSLISGVTRGRFSWHRMGKKGRLIFRAIIKKNNHKKGKTMTRPRLERLDFKYEEVFRPE